MIQYWLRHHRLPARPAVHSAARDLVSAIFSAWVEHQPQFRVSTQPSQHHITCAFTFLCSKFHKSFLAHL
jgi:hypothetical protein